MVCVLRGMSITGTLAAAPAIVTPVLTLAPTILPKSPGVQATAPAMPAAAKSPALSELSEALGGGGVPKRATCPPTWPLLRSLMPEGTKVERLALPLGSQLTSATVGVPVVKVRPVGLALRMMFLGVYEPPPMGPVPVPAGNRLLSAAAVGAST